jgi:2Fe-2S ferredoxin|tara:strand:+ start:429 stop:779 length:351 start_codon:yes stop_codon:yes gene_type:complete
MLIRLNIINTQGNKTAIDAKEGTTIRESVMNKLAPGNHGLCERNYICGTCLVYVAEEDFKKLKAVEENEIETLETSNIELITHSRLGCQIELKKAYNNIAVTTPSPESLMKSYLYK